MAKRTIEEAKTEAVKRMGLLKIHENALKEFKEKGRLCKSEMHGLLCWLNEQEKAMVKKFEGDFKAVAYHVVHQYTAAGDLYTILYVEFDDTGWGRERERLASGEAMAYVARPACSELGYVGLEPAGGGLERTW